VVGQAILAELNYFVNLFDSLAKVFKNAPDQAIFPHPALDTPVFDAYVNQIGVVGADLVQPTLDAYYRIRWTVLFIETYSHENVVNGKVRRQIYGEFAPLVADEIDETVNRLKRATQAFTTHQPRRPQPPSA
jgi:hypothetical protein